jgi:hypothetical protein
MNGAGVRYQHRIVCLFQTKQRDSMKELVYVVIFICVYVLVQMYVLPKMGIST